MHLWITLTSWIKGDKLHRPIPLIVLFQLWRSRWTGQWRTSSWSSITSTSVPLNSLPSHAVNGNITLLKKTSWCCLGPFQMIRKSARFRMFSVNPRASKQRDNTEHATTTQLRTDRERRPQTSRARQFPSRFFCGGTSAGDPSKWKKKKIEKILLK